MNTSRRQTFIRKEKRDRLSIVPRTIPHIFTSHHGPGILNHVKRMCGQFASQANRFLVTEIIRNTMLASTHDPVQCHPVLEYSASGRLAGNIARNKNANEVF